MPLLSSGNEKEGERESINALLHIQEQEIEGGGEKLASKREVVCLWW